MKKALTIAGSDSSGGAGIQADLKTFTTHKVYGMSVITAITAQNTQGVTAVQDINGDIVASQLDAVFTDIRPDSVKIGMVSSSEIIEIIADKLKEFKAKNIVLDTVMVSTSGHSLLKKEAKDVLINTLIPLANIITPNLFEAEELCGFKINSKEDMILAAKKISEFYKGYILIKGGHLDTPKATDLLFKDNDLMWFENERIDNENTHGTGCTLSSAISANLALGYDIETSVKYANNYVYNAIKSKLNLGKGRGPIDHLHNITYKINE